MSLESVSFNTSVVDNINETLYSDSKYPVKNVRSSANSLVLYLESIQYA